MPKTHDPRGGRLNDGLGGIVKDRVAKRKQGEMAVSRSLFATLEAALPAKIEAARYQVRHDALFEAQHEAERRLREAHSRADLNDWWAIDTIIEQARNTGAIVKPVEDRPGAYLMAWVYCDTWCHGATVPRDLVLPVRDYIAARIAYREA